MIVKFGLGDKFDLVELAVNMVYAKKNCKKLLDMEPSIRETVIRKLTTQQTSKSAADLVKHYKYDPKDFPELLVQCAKNTSNYFVSRIYRAETHEDHLSVHKVEDLFTGDSVMLLELVSSLFRKGREHQAKGVF